MAGKHELEKFEYLFVDIEWNQTPGTNGIEDREPIQIGVVATDENMNLKKSFSRAMRLSSEEKYNPDTLVLSHSTLKSVMQANSEESFSDIQCPPVSMHAQNQFDLLHHLQYA